MRGFCEWWGCILDTVEFTEWDGSGWGGGGLGLGNWLLGWLGFLGKGGRGAIFRF